MHSKRILFRYTNYNVAENKISFVSGWDFNRNNLTVFKTESLCISGCCVNVTLCSDYAVVNFDFALGANDFASACACEVA